ncbi:MAG: hypothetical protein U1G05_10090 [Kiritimatiellia bacterium]
MNISKILPSALAALLILAGPFRTGAGEPVPAGAATITVTANATVITNQAAAVAVPAGGVIQAEGVAVPVDAVIHAEGVAVPAAGAVQGGAVFKIEAQAVQGGMINVQGGGMAQVQVVGEGQLILQGNGAGPIIIRQGGVVVDAAGTQSGSTGAPRKDAPAETEDRIEFLNKDRLHGSLLGVDGAGGLLQWRHADSTNAIPFKTAGVSRVRMTPRPPEKASTNYLSSVTLTNDDYLSGRLVSLDADKLVLETEHLGTLQLERIMVRSFSPNSKYSALLYSGPTDLEGWNQGGRANGASWVVSNGALVPVMQFPITREIEGMPDLARMAFTAEWKAYPAFNFGFGASKPRGDMFGESGYNLMVSGNSIYFRRTTATEGSDNLWNINSDELGRQGSRKAAFELFVDRKKASFTLFLNGKQIKQWTDAKGYAGKGSFISFQSQVQTGLRFSAIRVAAWDGVVPDLKEDAGPAAGKDSVWFVNRDRVEGTVLAIRDGRAKINSEMTGEVEIPVERISEIHLAPDTRERARRNKGDVRVALLGGASVTADVTGMANGVLTARSENFNEIRIPLPRVVELEFNIYRRKPAPEVAEPESDIPVWVE